MLTDTDAPRGGHGPGPGAPTVQDWLARLLSGWQARDPDAIAELFTPDAVCREGPFGPARRGRREIACRWKEILRWQRGKPQIWFGEPMLRGNRAAVEWSCIARDPVTGAARAMAGCLVLRFRDDGRCAHLQGYRYAEHHAAEMLPLSWPGRAQGRGDRHE